jgi:hypothetical protein
MNIQPKTRFKLNRLFWKVGAGLLILPSLILPASSQPAVERPPQKFFHLGCFAGYPDGTFRGEQPILVTSLSRL